VLKDRLLREILGPEADEVIGDWRKLYTEGLHDFHSTPNIIRVIKSRRMRWAGRREHMGRREICTGFWQGNMKEGDHLEDLGIDGRIILK
jgi:hypothetical protein